MSHGYKQPYLVWLAQRAWNDADRGGGFEAFLYNDEVDDPPEDAWMDAIGSEPDDVRYNRQPIEFGGHAVRVEGREVRADFGEVEFDVTDSDEVVDSFGIVGEFEYFEAMGGEGHSPGDVVEVFVASGPMESPVDLSDYSGDWAVPVRVSLVSMY